MIRAAFLALLATTGLAGQARADVYADDLGKCLVNATTATDRTTFVQWMFAEASLNPAVREMTVVTPAQREQFSRAIAAIANRLLLKDCRAQAVAAMKYDGGEALGPAFQMLGIVAGRELMSQPDVAKAAARFITYLDTAQFQALGREAQAAPGAGSAAGGK